MIWIDHSRDFPKGSHTVFSPSKSGWMNDETEDDVLKRFSSDVAAKVGTEVHDEACECILTKTKYTEKEAVKAITKRLVLANISRYAFDAEFLANNFVNFVNDALGYGMQPEQALVYSEWCAGTTDAISFDETKKLLRIHDLKTGVLPAKFEQLQGYAALFFLEYGNILGANPSNTQIELRIYQGGEIQEQYPTAEDIVRIMDSNIWHTKVMQSIKKG